MDKSKSIIDLSDAFELLPGIGQRTAERYAYAAIRLKKEEIQKFIDAFLEVQSSIHPCPQCGLLIDTDKCPICSDELRTHDLLLVVNDERDALAYERLNSLNGQYFILPGVIDPIHGINPKDLHLEKLKDRIIKEEIKEVVLATSPTLNGETTALYIANFLAPLNITVTRLAYGLPMGADINYADKLTLSRSFSNRRKV